MIISRIRKLLALGKSSNSHEAAAALSKAQELMTQHGLTEAAIEISEITFSKMKTASSAKVLPEYIVMLANLIARTFGVKAIFERNIKWVDYRFQAEGFIEFAGPGSRPEVASYAYSVLGRQLARDRAAFLKAHKRLKKRGTRIERADVFCVGWVMAVSDVVAEYPMPKTERDLIDKAVVIHCGELTDGKVKSVHLAGRTLGDFHRGMESGSKARLHAGMGWQASVEQGLLMDASHA